jgi:hypothetical protein
LNNYTLARAGAEELNAPHKLRSALNSRLRAA